MIRFHGGRLSSSESDFNRAERADCVTYYKKGHFDQIVATLIASFERLKITLDAGKFVVSCANGGSDLIWKVALGSIAALAVVISSAGYATAQEKSIVVASTASATDSGLLGHLLPIFTRMTGITVNVVAVGTGLALDVGRRGGS